MDKVILVALLVVCTVVAFVNGHAAVKCYTCNYNETNANSDQWCKNVTQLTSSHLQDCPAEHHHHPHDHQYNCFTTKIVRDGKSIINRGCVAGGDLQNCTEEESEVGVVEEIETCHCNTDGCNNQ